MPKVICTLPNAAEEISGFKFVSHKDGMISEDLDEAVAARFLTIPGYEPAVPAKDEVAAAAEAAELEVLRDKAKALGVNVDARWKAERLGAEIEKAEKAKAAADAAKK